MSTGNIINHFHHKQHTTWTSSLTKQSFGGGSFGRRSQISLAHAFSYNSFQKYIYMEQVIIFINLLLWFIIWLPYRVYCEWSHSLLGWGISVAKTNKNRIIHCHKDSVKNVRYKTILTNYGITFYWHCVVLLVGE